MRQIILKAIVGTLWTSRNKRLLEITKTSSLKSESITFIFYIKCKMLNGKETSLVYFFFVIARFAANDYQAVPDLLF